MKARVVVEVDGKKYEVLPFTRCDGKHCSLYSSKCDGTNSKYPCDKMYTILKRADLGSDCGNTFKEITK